MDFSAERLADLLQILGVDLYAVGFHAAQHGYERHLYFVEQFLHAVFLQQGQQFLIELQCDVGILGGVFLDQTYGHLAHGLLHPSLADKVFDGDGDVVEVDLGKVVHIVALFGFEEVMRQHGVE